MQIDMEVRSHRLKRAADAAEAKARKAGMRAINDAVFETRKLTPTLMAYSIDRPNAYTTGVDNQSSGIEKNSASQGRLEAKVVDWGDGDESWSLGYHVIDGDPSTAEPWDVLNEILLRRYETEDGRTLVCQAACIDTGGHHSSAVKDFCGARTMRRVWGIKGANEAAGSRKEIWPKVASTAKGGGKIFLIGTQSAKDKVADHLAKKQPGLGYMHIPQDDRPAAWID